MEISVSVEELFKLPKGWKLCNAAFRTIGWLSEVGIFIMIHFKIALGKFRKNHLECL
jgi:hypothetical protein